MNARPAPAGLALLLLAACQTDPKPSTPGPTETGSPQPEESDPPESAPPTESSPPTETAETGPETGGAEGEGEGEGEEPTYDTIRFVALGDAGEGNDTQYQVAAAMEVICAERGCDFALYLGDNFYNSGVDSTEDDQWQTAFELPYAYLDFPFYAVLGNHDYGGEGLGYEYWKADYQVEYAETSDKWIMPDNYYTFTQGAAQFFGLDTNLIFWGYGDDHLSWMLSELSASTSPWKIGFGHHPYISNGEHGNAGNYEGLDWLPIVNGENVLPFMEEAICGQVDVYLCGHDHSRQWLEPTCGTEFLVSGAGSKNTDLENRDENPYYWQESSPGFVWVELTETTFTGVFYDQEGVEQYSRTITR